MVVRKLATGDWRLYFTGSFKFHDWRLATGDWRQVVVRPTLNMIQSCFDALKCQSLLPCIVMELECGGKETGDWRLATGDFTLLVTSSFMTGDWRLVTGYG